jgi:hypothetical protein
LFVGLGVPIAAAIAVFGLLDKGGLALSEKAIAAGIGLAMLAAAIRWPGAALGVVLVVVPLQIALFAWIYHLGAPGRVVHQAGYLKDIGVLGVVVAAALQSRARPHTQRKPMDTLDRFAVAYLAIATFYFLIPEIFRGSLGGEPRTVRLSAWRLDCLFVVLLLAARRYDFPKATLRRLRTAVLLVGILLLAYAIYESVDKSGYNSFIVLRLHVPEYQINILKVSPPAFNNYVDSGFNGGVNTVRVGSLFADALSLGFYMVLPLAYGLERLSTAGPRLIALLGTAAGATTVVLTETRSAILSGGLAVILMLILNQRRKSPGRLRMGFLTVVALALVLPLAAGTTAVKRFSDIGSTNNTDNQHHTSATIGGITDIVIHPQGRGLGANPVTGQRYGTSNSTDTENSYLQVGTELGLAGMIAFIGMYLSLLTRLWRRARAPGARGHLAAASWLAGGGLLVGGLFLQVWDSFSLSLTFFGLAGIALYRYDEERAPNPSSEPPPEWPRNRSTGRSLNRLVKS